MSSEPDDHVVAFFAMVVVILVSYALINIWV